MEVTVGAGAGTFITICFPYGGSPVRYPTQIEVHACFAHCTITVDEALRNLLNEGPPFSQFEAWLHGMFLDPTEYLNM